MGDWLTSLTVAFDDEEGVEDLGLSALLVSIESKSATPELCEKIRCILSDETKADLPQDDLNDQVMKSKSIFF